MKYNLRIKFSYFLPILLIILFNPIIELIFPKSAETTIPSPIVLFSILNYIIGLFLKNIFNKIVVYAWLIFFFLGILNINSVKLSTGIWDLKVFDSSILYHSCLLIFTISLFFFEKTKLKKVTFKDDSKYIFNSFFSYSILIYPILLLISIFFSIGFLPILIGENFVNEMYEYDYGFLYGFKIVSVFSFCLIILIFKKNKKILVSSLYILFLIFVVSVDGKRFILLLCILSSIPILMNIKSHNSDLNRSDSNFNYIPIIIGFSSIGIVYILINILRSGGDVNHTINLLVEKIPFGVEYKDYVHSFNTYDSTKIKDYNFELSALGSFLNSTILEIFNFNKNELYEMGSQHAWMRLYNEKFGIRLGIIAELYFAYGLFVLPLMTLIAYFMNRISFRLNNPKSYFNLITTSILFGLFFLLINGQATVFFGSLTLLIYVNLFFLLNKFLTKTK